MIQSDSFVYKINLNDNGDLRSIEVAEYNYAVSCAYGWRELFPNDANYPHNFLHFEEVGAQPRPNATRIPSNGWNTFGTGSFCWVHSQYSVQCSHALKRYYFDQENMAFHTVPDTACSLVPVGGEGGGGYETRLDDDVSVYVDGKKLEAESQSASIGESDDGGSNPDPSLPDFTVTQLELQTTWGIETNTFGTNEAITQKITIKNIGTVDASQGVEMRLYLSDGYAKDKSFEWKLLNRAVIDKEELQAGETQEETEETRV